MKNTHSDSWAKIKQDLLDFKDLEIAQNCIQPVLDRNLPNAKFMFVGEAPGQAEDEQGQPFVGRSGKLLRKLFEEAELNIDSIYLTSIVKFRPPKNRDPNQKEKKACAPFLIREIEIINPKHIVTLGRHSLQFFAPGIEIKQVHGCPLTIPIPWDTSKKMTITPIYHPAAALYRPALKETILKDLMNLHTL